MRLARLFPLFVVLLVVSCFSAQADDPHLGVTDGTFEVPNDTHYSHYVASGCAGNAPGMASPAAVHCHELGYEYEIADAAEGQYGICGFPDGSNRLCLGKTA